MTAAEREAAALVVAETARAEADARELLARETRSAREDAERAVTEAETEARAMAARTAGLERAVALVVDAVLPRAAAPVSPERR